MSSVVTTAAETSIVPPSPEPYPTRSVNRLDPGWLAVIVAVALAASPLAQGYFDFEAWGAIALGLLVILLVLFRISPPTWTRRAVPVAAGLAGLLALSAISALWAESKEAAWTDTNRLAFYCAVFAIVVWAVRSSRIARMIMLLLGASALIASIWLCAAMLVGGAQGYFAGRRLDWPIGYVNANAGLLVMGVWPWLALAETAKRVSARASALSAAALIVSTSMLTQSRALIPATVAAAILVLACAPGRTTRAMNLLLVAAAVGVSLTWTLRVYSVGGAAGRSLPPAQGVLRGAAVSIVAAALGTAIVRLGVGRLTDRLDPAVRRRARRRVGLAMAIVAIPLLVGGSVAAAPSIERQYRTFTAMRFNDAAPVRILDAGGYRYDLWRVAWREFERHPFLGLGAGNYDVEYYRLRRNPEYVLQPHSLELQTAAELGIGGLLALALFAGGVAWACFSRRGTTASGDRFVRLAAAGMFTAWLVGTSVDWLYDIPGLTGMGMAAAALLVVGREHPGRRVGHGLGRIWPVLGVGVIALVAASIGRQYAGRQYADVGMGKIARAPAAALSDLRQASALDPYSLTTLYAISAAFARENDYADARATLLAAAAREPHNSVPPALLGDLANRRGIPRAAADAYARALALDPRDVALRDALERARKTG